MTNNDSSVNMTEKTTVAIDVKQLLCGVTGQVDRHLAEADSDLHQTSLLLDEAIIKLTASFIAIHAAVGVQQTTMRNMAQNGRFTPEETATSLAQCDEISRNIDAAMIGLQFQDMTDQLLKRTSQRIAGVRDVCAELRAESEMLTAGTDVDGTEALLRQLNKQLHKRSDALHKKMWKAVCQTHMESG